MKSIKYVALGALLSISAFFAVLYTSCTKDACKGVACLNGGTCGSGICSCPTAVGGSNCQTVYRTLYQNTYVGVAMYGIIHNDTANTMVFTSGQDSIYNRMQLVWNDTTSHIALPITLSNFSSSGSDFTITSTPVDTFNYTGTGTVSSTEASVTIVATHAIGPALIISLHNFTKK